MPTKYVDNQKKLALAWERADLLAKQAEADLVSAQETAVNLRAAADKLNRDRDNLIAPISERGHKPLFPVEPSKKQKKQALIDRQIREAGGTDDL